MAVFVKHFDSRKSEKLQSKINFVRKRKCLPKNWYYLKGLSKPQNLFKTQILKMTQKI